MRNIYKENPRFQNDKFIIRKVSRNDIDDLFEIYSDTNNIPFFNSDNCHGETFYCQNIEKMSNMIRFWIESYKKGWFVRLSIIDRKKNKVVGTLENFVRKSIDSFNDSIALRLDLKSEYEKEEIIILILKLVVPKLYVYFGNKKIVTKGFNESKERTNALKKIGFCLSKRKMIGSEDNQEYDNYYVLKKGGIKDA